MSWAQSLIKLTGYEVEVLQKRLSDILDRRAHAEMRLAVLAAEGEAEDAHATGDAQSGWYLAGFREGLKQRKAAVEAEIAATYPEESGARDALAEAFESQKKYEQIAETARVVQRRETARRETAALDELGLRRAAGR